MPPLLVTLPCSEKLPSNLTLVLTPKCADSHLVPEDHAMRRVPDAVHLPFRCHTAVAVDSHCLFHFKYQLLMKCHLRPPLI